MDAASMSGGRAERSRIPARSSRARSISREASALAELCMFALRAGGRPVPHPQGNGAPVMVLPGFMTADPVTAPLRTYLARCGYLVRGWGLGVNFGHREAQFERLLEQVGQLSACSGEKVALVGWSLGGLYARELAKLRPGQVAAVLTLGSPITGDVRTSSAWPLYRLINGAEVAPPPSGEPLDQPPPVASVAIYSEADAIVPAASARHAPEQRSRAGAACVDIEVSSSHVGLPWNPDVLEAVGRALARYYEREPVAAESAAATFPATVTG